MSWVPALRVGAGILFMLSMVVSVLTFRVMDETQRWIANATRAMMGYALAERALQLDVLNARAGLLRNYDPVNADLSAARENLMALQRLPTGKRTRQMVEALVAKNEQRETLVERFKSDNALLQNSLTRFTAYGSEISSHYALTARVLRLTLDTSPSTVREAQVALDNLPRQPEGTPAAQLVSHARLLVAVLPRIDALLHSLRAMQMESRISVLQAVLQKEEDERAAVVQRLQFALGAGILLAVGALTALFMAQRLRTRELEAQAQNAQLSAAIAIPLIDTGHAQFLQRVQEAVHRLAAHIGARRLQLTIPTGSHRMEFSSPDGGVDQQWLGKLAEAADADDAWTDDRVVASRNAGQASRALDLAMAESDITDIVLLRTPGPFRVLIGFEPEGLAHTQRHDHLAGVHSALIAIAHGARRRVMQLEREGLERTLARARRMETIGAMASGVAHNFNNIIGAIGGFAEMGQDRSRSGSPTRRSFDEIRAAVARARDLVDDILSFAKQGRSAKQPIDLREVLTQTVRLLSAAIRHEGSFELQAADESYPTAGAGSDLQQVFLNICSNASHASGGRLVRITVQRIRILEERAMSHGRLDPAMYIVVTISDSGPGIPETFKRRLFEPFFTTKAAGTGLGLSTAWEIVQDHGGTIDVQNLDDGGACFSVWLPEQDADTIVPIVASGAQILLLSEPEKLSADEEMLAELGYEPLGFPLPIDVAAIGNAIGGCDAVLIATPRPAVAGEAMRAIGQILGARRLLLATLGGEALGSAAHAFTLRYPIIAEELARVLSGPKADV
jgi:signal transduction histidine kinase